MEAIGKVNKYICMGTDANDSASFSHFTFTINLANGVTPFMIKCPHCKGMAQSQMYRALPVCGIVTVTHAFYRPKRGPKDAATLEYMMNGAMLLAPLPEAVRNRSNDGILLEDTREQLVSKLQEIYGVPNINPDNKEDQETQ